MTLQENMIAAWQERRDAAFEVLVAADRAPALFKQATIDAAGEKYRKARVEIARWSA